MNRSIIVLFLCLMVAACKQTENSDTIKGLTIDPKIKNEVEKYIEDSDEYNSVKDRMQVYGNSVLMESFENDSLVFSSNDKKIKQLFKSFYLWRGDTLTIDGAFGLFGGIGFAINIYKGNATLYHMLSSDDFPSYAYKEDDSLIFRLEVPCTETKIVLSEVPDSTKKQIIYGYVEFKSGSYFASHGSDDGPEMLPRLKQGNNMRVYFKCGRLDF